MCVLLLLLQLEFAVLGVWYLRSPPHTAVWGGEGEGEDCLGVEQWLYLNVFGDLLSHCFFVYLLFRAVRTTSPWKALDMALCVSRLTFWFGVMRLLLLCVV